MRTHPGRSSIVGRGDRYVQSAVWFTLFERLWMLRGFNNMLTDPYTDERSFSRLRDQVFVYNLGIIDQWLSRGVDAVFFSDDWRRLYKSSYTRMFERVRSGGAHVWMHLCGDVTAILPDLIEIGLNVLNPVQPQAMDVRQLSRESGGTSHSVMPETPLDKSSPCSRRSRSTRLSSRQLHGTSEESMLSLQTLPVR